MSQTITRSPVVLEPASQEFVEATSKPPFIYELTPAEARKVLDDVQAAPIDKLRSTTAGSPSLPRSATCGCGSCGHRTPRGRCR